MSAAMKLNYDPKELARELNLRDRTAALIVNLRIESGLTYEEIEAKSRLSKEELLSWESGIKSPQLSDVARLAEHCGTSAAVNFNLGFNQLLRESQTRIAELQGAPASVDEVRPENFDALGAVAAFQMAA